MNLHVAALLVALSLFFTHEMDAVRCREWRIFPLLDWLDERAAMLWFMWMHVPLFALLVWGTAAAVAAGGNLFSLLFGAFCVIHGFLHWAYERHPRNEFRNPLSRSIIWSCAGAGLLAIASGWQLG